MSDEFRIAKPHRTRAKLTPDEQERILRNTINSHRLSGIELSAEDVEVCRQILREEITADEAVARALSAYAPTIDEDDLP